MIGQEQIDELKEIGDVDWITALRSSQIRTLMEDGAIKMSLFDERNLFEFTHSNFPLEQLVICRNPLVTGKRARTRQSLIAATVRELEKEKEWSQEGSSRPKRRLDYESGR